MKTIKEIIDYNILCSNEKCSADIEALEKLKQSAIEDIKEIEEQIKNLPDEQIMEKTIKVERLMAKIQYIIEKFDIKENV